MLESINSIEIFQKNIERTRALIEAMDRIKAYNHLYQMNEYRSNPKQTETISQIQNKQLEWIEQSCSEHAIISLTTAFETYYKSLIQELFFKYPDRLITNIKEANKIYDLINSSEIVSFEVFEKILKLYSRFDYIKFFNKASLPFLSSNDLELIEYLHIKRNYYVHNINRADTKITKKLKSLSLPIKENVIQTEVKRLCTKLERIILANHRKMLAYIENTK